MTEKRMNALPPVAGDRPGEESFGTSDRSPEEMLEVGFASVEQNDVEGACAAADAAATSFALSDRCQRALLLESIAAELSMIGNELADRAIRESGLSAEAVLDELAETLDQLRSFALELRDGQWMQSNIDSSSTNDISSLGDPARRQQVGIGTVVVLCERSSPLALSVVGRDTAAALAAGCPVIVAGDHVYPATRAVVAQAVKVAVSRCGFHTGSFAFFPGVGEGLMTMLLTDPRVKAVALSASPDLRVSAMRAAATRAFPIPVFAETKSVSPVIIFPAALMRRGLQLAGALVESLYPDGRAFSAWATILIAVAGPELNEFLREARREFERSVAKPVSTLRVDRDFEHRLDVLASNPAVQTIARGRMVDGDCAGFGTLFYTTGRGYLSDDALRGGILGPAGIVIGVRDLTEMVDVLEAIEGQSTVAVMVEPDDYQLGAEILPFVQRKADTILANDWPKGNDRMNAIGGFRHFPAARAHSSSIERFLRPIAYRNFPLELLPRSVRNDAFRTSEPIVDGGLGEPLGSAIAL